MVSYLFLIECSLITIFCTCFAQHVSHSAFVFYYAVTLFSLSLWTIILKNKTLLYLCLIAVVCLSAFFDKTIIYCLPIIAITYTEHCYELITYLKKSLYVVKIGGVLFILLVYSIVLHGDLLFIFFSLIVVFYTGMKVYYRFKAEELIQVQDMLSEYTLTHKKQQRQLQNDILKNTEAAILEERNRISVELHNSIGHTISAAILQLNALQYLVEKEDIQCKLALLQHSLERGMTEIRKCLHNIYNASFHLESALSDLIASSPIQIKYTYNIDTLPYLLKHDIFSILKECIANTLKHSGAAEMHINLTEQPLFYSIHISDNGRGCNILSSKSHGIGLTVIEETVKKNGGLIQFYSDKGFKIHITFPKGDVQDEDSYN